MRTTNTHLSARALLALLLALVLVLAACGASGDDSDSGTDSFSGDAADVVRCDPLVSGPASGCTASVAVDGSAVGIGGERIDAIGLRVV